MFQKYLHQAVESKGLFLLDAGGVILSVFTFIQIQLKNLPSWMIVPFSIIACLYLLVRIGIWYIKGGILYQEYRKKKLRSMSMKLAYVTDERSIKKNEDTKVVEMQRRANPTPQVNVCVPSGKD